MEVAIPGSNNGGSPFQREVREWQRIDPNTGALLTGRLEADRWINGSLNSYGKVVDSQNVSQPNGTQHSQRKQLEVLQARTSSGSMQVIRAHTVQTTSSRWTSSSSASSSNSSSPLMTSLSGGANHNIGGYLNSNHPQRFHANPSLTNESADNGPAADEDHLTSNFHLNHHPKQQQQQQQQQQPQQHHLFSTTPSLKLSNLMKSTPSVINGTSGSPNKANLHKPHDISATTSQRQQRHHQIFTSSSREQQQKSESTTAVTSALLQQTSSSSSLSSTSTTAAIPSYSRKPTTTSSGLFRYDSSRYDLPTTETYVGGIGSGSGKIIDICSRDIDDVGDDDDDNRDDRVNPSAARRQQPTATWQSTLQRGRSISTDDLTSNGNTMKQTDGNGGGDGGDNDDDEPAEWRRVSKIRRSFQFPSTTAPESSKAITSTVSRTRPLDLPERSVSVSKIRAELENGRRLSTAMRNNHVDLIALDNILNGGSANGSGTASPLTTKKKTASFLTAESLKEIRGKLKKLSDESLYKDDFVTKKEDDREDMPEKDTSNPGSVFQYTPRSNGNVGHTTNSLGSRSVKYKDTSSAEWHIRRKSYGFEKMSPPDDKSMFRFENSTDSGLGRSSDLGNWSPTTDSTNSAARATVITFGDQAKVVNSENKVRPMVQRRLRTRTQPLSEAESAEMKRHSIAVDESHYVRDNLRKTSAVHLNGFYSKDPSPQNSGFSDDNSRRQKRVEFCKTEVHFAAESGRVNIVETDGKPPPSNNFRRRRRSSSSSSTSSTSVTSTSSNSSLETNKTGLPVIHFGDERKAIFDETFDGEDDLADDKSSMSNVTVSIPINLERNIDAESRDGDEHQDEISIRGILKNKPIKPKPYHLGENIENTDALWGIQLKPITRRSLSGERDQSEEDFKEATVSKSVAERVRIVEERKDGSGYSTKINLSLSNSPYEWTDTGAPRSYYDDQLENDFYGVGPSPISKLSPAIAEEGLKSTPLIIKTLRSANQFDEAMRRLSISSNTSSGAETATASVTTKHVSSLSHITKATSTSSSSFNSSAINGAPFKVNSEVNKSSSYSSSSSNEKSSYQNHLRPIAAPRLRVVGSATNSISHQLSQLRRMYDYAGPDSDDSARADEEVKGYFGGADLDDDEDDDHTQNGGFEASELSGSWSRMKAKRTVLKIQTAKKVHQEVPQSNIMNIELHSPMATAIKKPESIRMQPPVAKPRTIHAVKQSTIHKQVDAQQNYQSQPKSVTSASAKEASDNLKIVKEARGARKLREHELSYFGVKPVSANTIDGRTSVTTSKPKLTTNPKRSLPSRKLTTPSTKEEETPNKWSLPSDKPDLLRHSPILVEPQIVTKTAVVAPSIATQSNRGKSPIDSSDDQTDGIYENLKKPSGPYCRQKDLARDEMILSEMTRSANQTLKAVSEEAARKDLRRRSISRQPSKPLETIDEKFTKPISKATTRSKLNAHRILRECTSRASSASSGDSLPGTPTRQRSRSRSRDSVDYVNIKPKSSSRTVKHRSSSRESQKSATSSIEDTAHKVEVIRKSKRSTTKDEPVLVRHQHNQQQRSFRSSTESHDRHKVTPRSSTRDRVESHDQHPSRSHRSSQATTKSDTEHKRSSHSSTVDSKSSTKAIRSRPENEKSSKSSTERVSRSKAHSSHSQSDHHHQSKPHRSTGSKSATMSSSGMNSDILIHSKNGNHPATGHSSSSSSRTAAKRCSKDRK